MKGMRFLILNEQGGSVNYGIITAIAAPGKFLCKFMRAPTVSRVVDVKELETYNLFDTQTELDAFITQLREDKKAAALAADKTPADSIQIPVLKKKKKTTPAEKRAAKKSNGEKDK